MEGRISKAADVYAFGEPWPVVWMWLGHPVGVVGQAKLLLAKLLLSRCTVCAHHSRRAELYASSQLVNHRPWLQWVPSVPTCSMAEGQAKNCLAGYLACSTHGHYNHAVSPSP